MGGSCCKNEVAMNVLHTGKISQGTEEMVVSSRRGDT